MGGGGRSGGGGVSSPAVGGAGPAHWLTGYCARRASLLDNQSGRVAAASCHASNGSHMERPRGTDAVINSGASHSSCPHPPDSTAPHNLIDSEIKW